MQNLFPLGEAKQPTQRNSQVGASMSWKLVKHCRWGFYFKKISGNLTLYLPHVIFLIKNLFLPISLLLLECVTSCNQTWGKYMIYHTLISNIIMKENLPFKIYIP
jgi:hypothetical protein